MIRRARTLILAAAALAAAGTVAGCGSSGKTAAVADSATSTAPATYSSPSPDTTAPDATTCDAFAEVYNSKLSPLLATPNANGDVNVYFTQLGDAFTALAKTLDGAADPYSQTIAKDAEAIAADPSSYTAMGSFNTDLQAFLKQCGISGS